MTKKTLKDVLASTIARLKTMSNEEILEELQSHNNGPLGIAMTDYADIIAFNKEMVTAHYTIFKYEATQDTWQGYQSVILTRANDEIYSGNDDFYAIAA